MEDINAKQANINSEKVCVYYGGMKFKLSDIMKKLNKAGLLPQPERTKDDRTSSSKQNDIITRYEGQYKLCFIRGNFAYFTPKPLTGEDRQWGDDWDDAPYQHNAGLPYDRDKMVKLAFDFPDMCKGFDYDTPKERSISISVEDINSRTRIDCSWLHFYKDHCYDIWAGNSIKEFINKVQANNGKVYTEV